MCFLKNTRDDNSGYKKAPKFGALFLAEDVGVEPTHGFNPVYGLAIRCITVLPILRRVLF